MKDWNCRKCGIELEVKRDISNIKLGDKQCMMCYRKALDNGEYDYF